MTELYNAVIQLLINLFGDTYKPYNVNNGQILPIFKGYDNKIVPPTNSDYVILTSDVDKNMSLGFNPLYNKDTHQNTYISLLSTIFHIDLYGQNAEDNARILNDVCQNGYANTFWRINDYKCSVYEVSQGVNLSDIFGRDMYNNRFKVDLKIFNNVVSKLNIPYFTEAQTNLRLANKKLTGE